LRQGANPVSFSQLCWQFTRNMQWGLDCITLVLQPVIDHIIYNIFNKEIAL
jgi:hypothetical protein